MQHQNKKPQLKNTVYICFHSINVAYISGKAMTALPASNTM